jgi:hypothetical protein
VCVCVCFNYCCTLWGVHCGIYKSSYNVSYLNSPLHHSLLFPSLSIPEIVSTGLIFHFHT